MGRISHLHRRWPVLTSAAVLLLASAGLAANQLTSQAADGHLATASSGCGKAPTLRSGTQSLDSGGQNRSYILEVPDTYDSSHPYRLVFAFHWMGGRAEDVANGYGAAYYGLQALADDSAIFVAPQGLGNGWANPGGRDIAFVDDMVTQLEAGLCVDTTQLFSLGFSYGGGMSYALACARATTFRAVAIYSGGLISGCSGSSQPIAYLQAHGISDNVLPISGAATMRNTFAKINGCTAANPPDPAAGSGTHTSYSYSGCSSGHPVSWYAFDGGHIPFPADSNGTRWLPGETWKFFTQFPATPPPATTPSATTPSATTPSATGEPGTTPPATTPTMTPTATDTGAPIGQPGATCTATYDGRASWPGGFLGVVTVTAGPSTVNGWTVGLTVPDGVSLIRVWNGVLTGSAPHFTVRNRQYNATLAPGSSAVFFVLGTGSVTALTPTCTSP